MYFNSLTRSQYRSNYAFRCLNLFIVLFLWFCQQLHFKSGFFSPWQYYFLYACAAASVLAAVLGYFFTRNNSRNLLSIFSRLLSAAVLLLLPLFVFSLQGGWLITIVNPLLLLGSTILFFRWHLSSSAYRGHYRSFDRFCLFLSFLSLSLIFFDTVNLLLNPKLLEQPPLPYILVLPIAAIYFFLFFDFLNDFQKESRIPFRLQRNHIAQKIQTFCGELRRAGWSRLHQPQRKQLIQTVFELECEHLSLSSAQIIWLVPGEEKPAEHLHALSTHAPVLYSKSDCIFLDETLLLDDTSEEALQDLLIQTELLFLKKLLLLSVSEDPDTASIARQMIYRHIGSAYRFALPEDAGWLNPETKEVLPSSCFRMLLASTVSVSWKSLGEYQLLLNE